MHVRERQVHQAEEAAGLMQRCRGGTEDPALGKLRSRTAQEFALTLVQVVYEDWIRFILRLNMVYPPKFPRVKWLSP